LGLAEGTIANMVIYVLMVAMLMSILATIVIHIAIVEGINSRRPDRSRISYFNRDLLIIFHAHRQLYPNSRLRQVMMTLIALEVALGFGFILRLTLP
jgi:hypothetical protein